MPELQSLRIGSGIRLPTTAATVRSSVVGGSNRGSNHGSSGVDIGQQAEGVAAIAGQLKRRSRGERTAKHNAMVCKVVKMNGFLTVPLRTLFINTVH